MRTRLSWKSGRVQGQRSCRCPGSAQFWLWLSQWLTSRTSSRFRFKVHSFSFLLSKSAVHPKSSLSFFLFNVLSLICFWLETLFFPLSSLQSPVSSAVLQSSSVVSFLLSAGPAKAVAVTKFVARKSFNSSCALCSRGALDGKTFPLAANASSVHSLTPGTNVGLKMKRGTSLTTRRIRGHFTQALSAVTTNAIYDARKEIKGYVEAEFARGDSAIA